MSAKFVFYVDCVGADFYNAIMAEPANSPAAAAVPIGVGASPLAAISNLCQAMVELEQDQAEPQNPIALGRFKKGQV